MQTKTIYIKTYFKPYLKLLEQLSNKILNCTCDLRKCLPATLQVAAKS